MTDGPLSRWWKGLSSLGRTVVRFVLLLPLAELAFWAFVEWIGGRQGWLVIAGVAGVCTSIFLLFTPTEVLEDPELAGKIAKDYPVLVRFVCVIGVLACVAFTLAVAFASQLGLPLRN